MLLATGKRRACKTTASAFPCAKLSRGADGFIAILRAIGMPFADLQGWATIIVEIVGGLFEGALGTLIG
jgi:uncharacterized membrane protein YphA (DoxX/SURF4 family)